LVEYALLPQATQLTFSALVETWNTKKAAIRPARQSFWHLMPQPNDHVIAQRHIGCHFAFQQLCEAAQGSKEYHHHLLDEFDKYSLWAGNVGAGYSGKTYKLSLDYRLREASFYKDQVTHTFLLIAQGTSRHSRTNHCTDKEVLITSSKGNM